jgi:hypothetical protein
MINLLPDDTKVQIRAARTNVVLVRYILIIILGISFLLLVVGGAYVILSNTKAAAQAVIDTNDSKTSPYAAVQTQADSLRSSLATAKNIFDQEVDYTKILSNIASTLPNGVIIDKFTLSSASFGTPVTWQIYAKTSENAVAVKEKFQVSPLFSNITISTLSASSAVAGYPIAATVTVTLNKGVSL